MVDRSELCCHTPCPRAQVFESPPELLSGPERHTCSEAPYLETRSVLFMNYLYFGVINA